MTARAERRGRGALAATAVAVVLILTGAVRASTGDWGARGEGSMSPALVIPKPHGVRAGATGSFSVSFWRFRAGLHSARFRLATSRLTGSVLTAHIHTGAPGRNGPVLLTLCTQVRCELGGGTIMVVRSAGVESWVETMTLLGAYIDVHTKRNPRGELRGQVEIRRYGS